MSKENREFARKRRQLRVRRKITGTAARPRLNVFRSLNHIYAQIINDQNQTTLVTASSLDPELRMQHANGGNKEAAREVGTQIAKKALAKGINSVIFDRAGYKYHGRVAALAEAAREAGLEF